MSDTLTSRGTARLAALLLAGCASAITASTTVAPVETWTEATFQDFRDGTFDAAGANLYVSAQGALQPINHWDVNGDGYIDLFFGNTHDFGQVQPVWVYYSGQAKPTEVPSQSAFRLLAADLDLDGWTDLVVGNRDNNVSTRLPAYIYWGGAAGFSTGRRSELPTDGVAGFAAADLNRDGFPDLVCANELGEASFVYWGAPGGPVANDRSDYVTSTAKGVAIADFNRDGWLDLAFANGSDRAGGSFIYWGSEHGLKGPAILPTRQAVGVAAADLDDDGYPEVVFANFAADPDGSAYGYVYRGGETGFSASRRTLLPTQGATGVTAADFDGDRLPELVFPASLSGSRTYGVREYRDRTAEVARPATVLYWNGRQGFSRDRVKQVPISTATSCAAVDHNADGRPDLVCTVLRGERTFDAESLVFLNAAAGFDWANPVRLATRGATDVVASDFNRDGKIDLAFANKVSGNADGTVPSYVYLGAKEGYATDARLELPSSGSNEGKFADFNDDGFVDILVCNQDHDDRTRREGSRIFWGSAQGFAIERSQKIDVDSAMGAAVADLNRDGHLDIVFSTWDEARDALFVYWGGSFGYRRESRVTLPLRDGRAVGIADVNGDGHLDIIGTSVLEDVAKIFWGSQDGFSAASFQTLSGFAPVSVEVADLNRDSYPDIVLCNFMDISSGRYQVPSYIYWGSAGDYSAARRTALPTMAAHDAAVLDANRDGFLDVVFSNYRDTASRTVPSYIYWGSATGFDPRVRTLLPARGSAGMMAADLDRDGWWDLVFANHTTDDGSHQTASTIVWGSPYGNHLSRVTALPALGPHNMLTVDLGHKLTREFQEAYLSSPKELSRSPSQLRAAWEAETPRSARIRLQVRLASTRAALEQAKWIGAKGEDSFLDAPGDIAVPTSTRGKWVQYRLVLTYGNGADNPRVRNVRIESR